MTDDAADQRAQDRRALKLFLFWIGGCAALGALYLIVAIWVDWI